MTQRTFLFYQEMFIFQVWFKKEPGFDEEKGDNDFDAGDNETSLPHDIKREFEDTKEEITSRGRLQFHYILNGISLFSYFGKSQKS